MSGPDHKKTEQARRWLGDETLDLDEKDRTLLEEFVRRYPDDPTMTPVDRRRLARGYSLLVQRLPRS